MIARGLTRFARVKSLEKLDFLVYFAPPDRHFQEVIQRLCNESNCCIINPESSCGKPVFEENEPPNS